VLILATLSIIAHGIDPADGRITGSRPRHSGEKTDTYRVSALIANRTRPSLARRVEIVEIDGLTVLAVEVSTFRTPVSTPEGKYQRRAIGGKGKPECMPFLFPEMLARQADRGIQDYSSLVVPDARWEDLGPLEFERFLENDTREPGKKRCRPGRSS